MERLCDLNGALRSREVSFTMKNRASERSPTTCQGNELSQSECILIQFCETVCVRVCVCVCVWAHHLHLPVLTSDSITSPPSPQTAVEMKPAPWVSPLIYNLDRVPKMQPVWQAEKKIRSSAVLLPGGNIEMSHRPALAQDGR